MISLKQLTYALAVRDTLHFKQAAERCHVSQSTLSSAINELETQLGPQLFERDNKKVLVTPLGEQILARATSILTDVQDLELLAKSKNQPLTRPMRLGVIPTIGPYLLPKVLPALRQQHPDFELTLVEEQSAELVAMVRRGELDTAIIALPYALDGLLSFEFWQENFVVLCHSEHALASQSKVTAAQLESEPLLLLREGHCLTDHALSVCRLPKSDRDRGVAGTSLFTLVQMVAGRLGVTLVPEMAESAFLTGQPDLTACALDEPGPHRTLAFIVRPNYTGVSDVEALRSLFKAQLAG